MLVNQRGTRRTKIIQNSPIITDGSAYDELGHAVALDGDMALIGAHVREVAYVLEQGEGDWIEQHKLEANDGVQDDNFGYAVALDGNVALVSAIDAKVGFNYYQGAVYVFTYDGTSWTQQQKLVADDGDEYNYFGYSIAMDENIALIGAIGAEAAYLFFYDGTSWIQQQKLVADDAGSLFDNFGWAVALDGNTALIGAAHATRNFIYQQGIAYIFGYDGTTWTQQQKLVADDANMTAYFGHSVALNGDKALIGAYRANVNENQFHGAAYLFAHNGTSWIQQQKLAADDGAENAYFGYSVALEDDTALVGATQFNTSQGAVYVFLNDTISWTQQQKLTSDNGRKGDYFGHAIALDDNMALIGAPNAAEGSNAEQGKIYFFEYLDLQSWLPIIRQ